MPPMLHTTHLVRSARATETSANASDSKPAYNSRWTTCGRKLLRDGKAFFVRGVNYAPTPIGHPGRLDLLNDSRIFSRDLANLRGMHANAIKTYDYYGDVDHTAFLDAAFNDGDRPIYAIFSIWIDEDVMSSSVAITSDAFAAVERSYFDMALRTGGHAGVLGYSIGGEMNRHRVLRDAQFWHKFAVLTAAVRRGLAANSNAQKIITTTFMNDGGRSFHAGAQYVPDVDMWGSNVYQTNYEGSVLPTFLGVPGGKPLLVSEYGVPYASDTREGNAAEQVFLAQMLVNQTIAMQANFDLRDALQEQVTVGGFVFEYSDEWWKAGDVDTHNLGSSRGSFPLGFWAEEYFGLFSAARNAERGREDVLHARPSVALLRELWAQGPLAHEGVDHSQCNYTAAAIAAKRDEEIYGSHGLGLVGSLLVALTVCVAGVVGFVFVRARMRRARYQRIPSLAQSPMQ